MAKHLRWNWTRSTKKTERLEEKVYQMTLVDYRLQEHANEVQSMQNKVLSELCRKNIWKVCKSMNQQKSGKVPSERHAG